MAGEMSLDVIRGYSGDHGGVPFAGAEVQVLRGA
jgi:hypothetical protein